MDQASRTSSRTIIPTNGNHVSSDRRPVSPAALRPAGRLDKITAHASLTRLRVSMVPSASYVYEATPTSRKRYATTPATPPPLKLLGNFLDDSRYMTPIRTTLVSAPSYGVSTRRIVAVQSPDSLGSLAVTQAGPGRRAPWRRCRRGDLGARDRRADLLIPSGVQRPPDPTRAVPHDELGTSVPGNASVIS
jgi:hypothetical protein